MQGEIRIKCDGHGVDINMDMRVSGSHDSAFLVHALGKALGLHKEDYIVLAIAEDQRVLDDGACAPRVTIDTDELLKQLKEKRYES